MRIRSEDFAKAAIENVKNEFGYGRWLVYDEDDYKLVRIGKGDDAYIKVSLVPSKTLEEPDEYNPLLVRGLFLEFAELAEGREVTQDDWLDWTKRWGVLGVDWRERPVSLHRGGDREKFSSFKHEVELANWVLRLYEAATAEDGPDVPRIRELLELDDDDTGSAKEIKGWALSEVARTVQRRLIGECFPRLYGLKDYTFVHSPSGFGSLGGAMWLQMMYLLTATGKKIKRCGGPGCDKIIYFGSSDLPDEPKVRGRAVRATYKSRDYCSTNCRVKRWQRDQKNKSLRG
jgi:hypothetical protein